MNRKNITQKTFNLTGERWKICNYMFKHGIVDTGMQEIIIKGFITHRDKDQLNYKERIQYISDHFGLFCQYANNSKVQLDNLKSKVN